MKRNYVLIIAILVMALVVSCGSAPVNQQPAANMQVLPSWYNQMPPPGEIWGRGGEKMQNPNLARQAATANAQRNAAEQFGVEVKGMLDLYSAESGLHDNPRSISATENVQRTIVNMNLTGATVNASEQTSDGTWWVRVSVNKADALRQIVPIINNEMADFAEFKADQALRRLEASLNTGN